MKSPASGHGSPGVQLVATLPLLAPAHAALAVERGGRDPGEDARTRCL